MEVIKSPKITKRIHDSIPTYYCGDGADYVPNPFNVMTNRYAVTVEIEFKSEDMAKVFCNSLESEIARFSRDD